MTKGQLQDLVIAKMQDKITDTFSIRERISNAFTEWFKVLVAPQAPAESPAPPEPQPTPQEQEAPPNET